MLVAYYEIEKVYNDDYNIWEKKYPFRIAEEIPKIVLQPKVGIFWNMLVAYLISIGFA